MAARYLPGIFQALIKFPEALMDGYQLIFWSNLFIHLIEVFKNLNSVLR